MKRAPGCASAAARLWVVGSAGARSASSETPAYRPASSSRLAAAISPRTPTGSATARLHEALEHLNRAPRRDRLVREDRSVAERRCLARGQQQRGRIEHDDVLLGTGRLARQHPLQASRVFLNVAAGDDVERRAFEARLFGRDFEFIDLAAKEPHRARLAVQRDLVEARTM